MVYIQDLPYTRGCIACRTLSYPGVYSLQDPLIPTGVPGIPPYTHGCTRDTSLYPRVLYVHLRYLRVLYVHLRYFRVAYMPCIPRVVYMPCIPRVVYIPGLVPQGGLYTRVGTSEWVIPWFMPVLCSVSHRFTLFYAPFLTVLCSFSPFCSSGIPSVSPMVLEIPSRKCGMCRKCGNVQKVAES